MKRFLTPGRSAIVAISIAMSLSACAHITFQTEATHEEFFLVRWFTQNEGIHYFRPQPYLLVTLSIADKPGATGKPAGTTEACTVEIKYLPDYSHEYVMVPHYWLGSVAMKPTLTDGWNLTNFDSTVDTKIPETITALASLSKSIAPGGAFTPNAMIANVPEGNKATEGMHPGFYPLVEANGGGLAIDKARPIFQTTSKKCDYLFPVAEPKPPTPAKK
jgi:hypothetical protein